MPGMDEKERKEMEALCKKTNRTEKEIERYKELLRIFFEETLYHGGDEED